MHGVGGVSEGPWRPDPTCPTACPDHMHSGLRGGDEMREQGEAALACWGEQLAQTPPAG